VAGEVSFFYKFKEGSLRLINKGYKMLNPKVDDFFQNLFEHINFKTKLARLGEMLKCNLTTMLATDLNFECLCTRLNNA
jgi:septation ring formation regulator EzrA